jgi:ATP-dependent DNA helicase PIF1
VKAEFAFESPEWGRFAEHTWKLTTVRRQTDQDFVQGLMAIRRGDVGPVLDLFRPRISLESDINFPGTTIVAKNDIVDRINMTRHAKIKGEMLTFQTIRAGEQQSDWLKQIPHQTQVKVGALVMILANRYEQLDETERELLYANGDLGEVMGKGTSGVLVKLQRTGEVEEVKMVTREWREPTGKKKPPYTVKGSVSYMPLRLAYATTVHKSQGLSLDRVQVNILDRFFGSPSMLYVALSRARTLEGLSIVGTPKLLQDRCAVDPQIQGWI